MLERHRRCSKRICQIFLLGQLLCFLYRSGSDDVDVKGREAAASSANGVLDRTLPLLFSLPQGAPRGKQASVLLAGVGTKNTVTPGGQQNVGRLFAEQLIKMGADIACVARSQDAADELEAAGIRVAGIGDLTDKEFAKSVVLATKPSTVFTAVGGKSQDGNRIDNVANINLFEAAKSLGQTAPNVVFVTSWGCGETWEFLDERTKQILGPALKAKTEAEEFLRESGLRHTIVRPGGLLSEQPSTGKGIFIRGRPEVGGIIRRQDLAEMLVWLPRKAETNGLAVTAVDAESVKMALNEEDILPFASPGD